MAQFNIGARLTLDGSQFHGGMRRADEAVRMLGSRLAALFSVGAAANFVRTTVQWASNMTDLAAQTGLAVEELQRMDAVARTTGTSLERMTKAFQNVEFKRFMALRNPGGEQAFGFRAFGITEQQLNTASTKELFDSITKFVRETKNKESLIGPLRAVFEETGPAMIEAFSNYASESIQNLAVISGETAAELDRLSDQLALFKRNLMAALAPVLAEGASLWNKAQAGLTGLFTAAFGMADPRNRDRNFWDVFDQYFTGAMKGVVSEIEGGGQVGGITRSIADFTPARPGAAPGRAAPFYTDPLVGVGNFLGAGRGTMENTLTRIQQKQLETLVDINTNIIELVRKASGGIFPA